MRRLKLARAAVGIDTVAVDMALHGFPICGPSFLGHSPLDLFQAPQGNAMILFMWQDDIIGVARFIDACLERVSTSAGPPVGDQASDQP